MKKLVTLLLSLLLLVSYTNASEKPTKPKNYHKEQLTYPTTKKTDVTDSYFGTQIADPYRWLEDDRSTATKKWVRNQNQLTFKYLKQIPYRNELKQRLKALWNFEKISMPFKEGDYTYFYKNNGLQNQYVVYRKKENGKTQVFLDPNSFSKDGTTSLSALSFSKDGSIAAYSISEGGSDWRKIIIIDTKTNRVLEAPITNVKFSNISWKSNEGFFYSSYDKPKNNVLHDKTDQHKLYYHKIGQAQKDDKIVFGATKSQKHRYVNGTVTEDDKYLIISAANTTSGNKLFIQDLSKPKSPIIAMIDNMDHDTHFLDNSGEKIFLVTNKDAPNKKVVSTNIHHPTPNHWIDVIKETNNVLVPSTAGGYIFANYMVDATSRVFQYDYDGKLVTNIKLPELGTAIGFSGKKDDKIIYYSFTNYKTPPTIYSLDPKKNTSSIYFKSAAKFESEKYISKQVFYKSKDGTKVPMIITYKKDLKLDGSNPTILYGYGGFNISLTPFFSIPIAVWLEQGGIYAVANLRGGGEYGKQWHNAGIKMHKQNVFDDFIAASQYLIKHHYTNNKFLAIRGASNGGLLVGAVMTQRPDLFKVALPAVGVLDMLRYHKFTAGAGWAYDYGTSEQSREMFQYLKAYSPVHNVKEGTAYPATLIMTADHDDRVVPAHSFKFAAELQSKKSGTSPILIRIETNVGHGSGTPVQKTINQYADAFAFTLFNMGFQKLPTDTYP